MSGFGAASIPRLVVRPEALPVDLRLRAFDWGVYFSVTGGHNCAQIARHGALPVPAVVESLARLAAWGLVEEELLSLGGYLRSSATCSGEEPLGLAQYLRLGLEGAAAPYDDTLAESDPGPVESELDAAEASPPPLVEFEPLLIAQEDFAVPETSLRRNLSLRAVMDALMRKSTSADAGQLDVYRTFLRIDPSLLRRNGITTLHFEDDRVVNDPELLEAIVDSAARTLGESLPAAVFIGRD